jgi:hypothetical protein
VFNDQGRANPRKAKIERSKGETGRRGRVNENSRDTSEERVKLVGREVPVIFFQKSLQNLVRDTFALPDLEVPVGEGENLID